MVQEQILLFVFTIAICLVGSFSKEYLRMWQKATPCVSITRVIVADAAATMFAFGGSDYLCEHFGLKAYITISWVFGMLGFEILERSSRLDEVLKFINEFILRGGNKRDK